MNTLTGEEVPSSDVGFPKGNSPEEFLANMLAFLEAAAAKIANPPPWPEFSPDALRDIASIQEAVLIEKEVSKGEAGNPTVVARADLLREDVWNRWRAGAGIAHGGAPLSDVLGKLTEVADRQLSILEQTSATSAGRSARTRDFRPVKPEQSRADVTSNVGLACWSTSAPRCSSVLPLHRASWKKASAR